MFAFKLIQLVETRAEPLSEGLMRRLKKNDRCIELLRRVPSDELRIRSHEIYRNLNDWLRNKTESEIEERYIGLGMKRAKQGVPYADFLWAISTTKEHLWEFMQSEGLFAEPVDMFGGMDLLRSLDRFFDRILYFAAVGYQNALQPHGRNGCAVQDRIEHRARSVASKRQGPRRHLVQYRTKREQVGTGVEFLPSNLFGRHISHGAQRTAGTGEMFLGLDGRGAHGNALRLEGDLRQPKIENLRLTSIRDEDVRGLDVAVDYAFGVRSIQRIGNRDAQIEHRLHLQRLASDLVPERLPLQQFHGDKGAPIGLVDFVNRADVRMIQRGRSLGFPLEAAEGLCIVGEFVGKEFQGDVTTELEVFRLVDHAHSPATDLAEDAVVRDGLADHLAEILGLGVGQVNEGQQVGRVSALWLTLNPDYTHWPGSECTRTRPEPILIRTQYRASEKLKAA